MARRPTSKVWPAFTVASLGTLQGARFGLFRTIAEAARRGGFRLVLAHGGRLTAEQVAALPGRPSAHAFVPQRPILAAEDVAIVNGGLNTVMDALAEGVPLVVVPIAFEQAAVAARVERAGAGHAKAGMGAKTAAPLEKASIQARSSERHRSCPGPPRLQR